MRRPIIYISDILSWADAFHKRFRRWPCRNDGPVEGQLDLTWCGIDLALKRGNRGLRPGSSLAKLLLQHRGVRHKLLLPQFTKAQILTWADAFYACTGTWPSCHDGRIEGVAHETWLAVDKALRDGRRGFPGGSSLAQLLDEQRGVRNPADVPRLTPKQVLAWADAHKERAGAWPFRFSGAVAEAPGETWHGIDAAFVAGSRGLAGFGSLARFLTKMRGVRNPKRLPRLSVKQILAWAKAYHERTGRWPNHLAGPIAETPGETWGSVHHALCKGIRGLPKSTLYQVLWKLRARRQCMRH